MSFRKFIGTAKRRATFLWQTGSVILRLLHDRKLGAFANCSLAAAFYFARVNSRLTYCWDATSGNELSKFETVCYLARINKGRLRAFVWEGLCAKL